MDIQVLSFLSSIEYIPVQHDPVGIITIKLIQTIKDQRELFRQNDINFEWSMRDPSTLSIQLTTKRDDLELMHHANHLKNALKAVDKSLTPEELQVETKKRITIHIQIQK